MRNVLAFLLCLSPLLAQSSVTVTSYIPISPEADQLVMSVRVTAALTSTRDSVLAAVRDLGLSASDLTYIQSTRQISVDSSSFVTRMVWNFRLTTPFGNLTAAVAQLTAVQKKLVQAKGDLSLDFSVDGTSSSSQSQAAACSLPALMADARAQAQRLAEASGGSAGRVLAILSGPGVAGGCSATVKFAVTGF